MEIPSEIIYLLQRFDFVNLMAIGAMLWIFNKRWDKKFKKIHQRFDKMEKKFEAFY